MLHHDVITIVAIFTIVAMFTIAAMMFTNDHNHRNTNHNCREKPQLLQSCTTTIVCRNATHKCRKFLKILYMYFLF